MPRLNFRIATLAEGISTSTGTSRRVTQGMRTLRGGVSTVCVEERGEYVQDSHEDREPELLRAEEGVGVGVVFSGFDVVGVAEDDEYPCHLVHVNKGSEITAI
jgi:hypothetical protein